MSWMNPSGEDSAGELTDEGKYQLEFYSKAYEFFLDLFPTERRMNYPDDGDDEANGCQHRSAQNPRVG